MEGSVPSAGGSEGGVKSKIVEDPEPRLVRPPKAQQEITFSSPRQPVCWSYLSAVALFSYVVVVVSLAFVYENYFVLVLLLAILPALVAFVLLRYLQRDNVSWPLVLEMFWLGLFGAIPIAFIEAFIAWLTINHWKDNPHIGVMFAVATLNAFIIAAVCEETFKYICISRVVQDPRSENCWRRHPAKPYGTILCGCSAALGFATIENILYVNADLAVQTAAMRALLAVPGHCAGGVIIAVGVCEMVFYNKETNCFWITLPSILFHGFYDWFLMASAIGYQDSQKTGDALAMAGLICAMLTDVVQFLYMFRQLNLLEEQEVGYTRVTEDCVNE